MQTLIYTPAATSASPTSILLGPGALAETPRIVGNASTSALLFDVSVQQIAESLAAHLPAPLLLPVQSGDATKSLADVERLARIMLDAGCSRDTTLLCVGGGMATDVGGFLASVYMRGIPAILVPTTLLGMVDASIGGKTAVNAGGRKNVLGTIAHPRAVIADIDVLASLPDAQLREGMAEVVKIAAIADRTLFTWLEKHVHAACSRDTASLQELVEGAVQAKLRIVERDERDQGDRLFLNFGHTVGHAIEALSDYRVSHGDAISIGMCAEMRLVSCPCADRVFALLQSIGLPVQVPASMDPNALWQLMRADKKVQAGDVRIAVPRELGVGEVRTLSRETFLAAIHA